MTSPTSTRREPVSTISERKLDAWARHLHISPDLMDPEATHICLIAALVERVGELEEDIRALQEKAQKGTTP